MATLERVMQMRQQGVSEPQIIQVLKQEGISPREINEALSQSQIKSALSFESKTSENPGDIQSNESFSQMQPSRTYNESAPEEAEMYSPEQSLQGESIQPITQPTGNYAMQLSPPSPYTDYYPEYQPQQATDIGTINDIAEQIVEEKTMSIKKQMLNLTRFKEETALEVEKINERLEKIENTFNELQMAIIRKIGEYGEDIHNISKELHNTQDSFSKLVNPLTDNIREMQKMTNSSSPRTEKPRPQTKPIKSEKDSEGYSKPE